MMNPAPANGHGQPQLPKPLHTLTITILDNGQAAFVGSANLTQKIALKTLAQVIVSIAGQLEEPPVDVGPKVEAANESQIPPAPRISKLPRYP